jgi:cysteine synthase A
MVALGAELTLVPAPGGITTKEVILEMIETARKMASAPGHAWMDQFNNKHQVSAYTAMANELWAQTNGKITTFVQSVGTCGSLRGNSTRLRELDPKIRVIAVEPSESAVLSGKPSGGHFIEGTGPGFVMPHWNPSLADEIQTVSSAEAMAMARRLAREEGIFAGTSTGSNLVVALREAARLGPGATVVTLAVDSGMKYLSTELYRS